MRAASSLSLLALVLLPGCFFTGGVWDWAEDDGFTVDAWPESITGSNRRTGEGADDEGFDVFVRWTDGSTSTERVGREADGSPADLVAGARAFARAPADPAKAAWLLRLATTRGWPRRDFVDDAAFAALGGQPDFAVACAAPISSPTFFLGPTANRSSRPEQRDLWLRGTADEVAVVELLPKVQYEDTRGGPLGYLVAVLVTPVTLALDIVTFPGQVVFVVLLGRALAGVGQH